MFILFDANVWISQLGLQSKHGAAVRYFARKQGAIVVIPEIVQLEVEEVLARRLINMRTSIRKGYRNLLPVFGQLQSNHLPSEDDIRDRVANIIPDFDVPTRSMPFNLEAARSSMMKLLRKAPPSATKEEFRDGVIWAHCLELLGEGDVYFVSEDTDFYEHRKYEKGLAHELVGEMRARSNSHEIKLFSTLESLLGCIRVPIEVDVDQLFALVRESEEGKIQDLLEAHGFDYFGSLEGEVACFATEKADEVYLRFELNHSCRDTTGAGRREGQLRVKGSGFLNPELTVVREVTLSHVLLDYPDWKGGDPTRGYVSVSAHFNAPEVHQIRVPLEQD